MEFLCRIGSQMKENDLGNWFIPLVKGLAVGEWFTARVSTCGLFHIAYPSVSETSKMELQAIYSPLCQDDMSTEDQDSVGLLVVEGCAILGTSLEP